MPWKYNPLVASSKKSNPESEEFTEADLEYLIATKLSEPEQKAGEMLFRDRCFIRSLEAWSFSLLVPKAWEQTSSPRRIWLTNQIWLPKTTGGVVKGTKHHRHRPVSGDGWKVAPTVTTWSRAVTSLAKGIHQVHVDSCIWSICPYCVLVEPLCIENSTSRGPVL